MVKFKKLMMLISIIEIFLMYGFVIFNTLNASHMKHSLIKRKILNNAINVEFAINNLRTKKGKYDNQLNIVSNMK